MSAFGTALRSSAAARSVASNLSRRVKPSRTPAFPLPKQTLLSNRICRSPVEISSVSLMSYHTATASSLMNSMLSVNMTLYDWNPDDR